MKHHPLFVYANYAEAILWIVLAALALRKCSCAAGRLLAGSLFLFGISDLVETRTGAWYEPWWLLAWKLTCGATIAVSGFVIWRRSSCKM